MTHLTLVNKPHDEHLAPSQRSIHRCSGICHTCPNNECCVVSRGSPNNQTHSVQAAVKAAQWRFGLQNCISVPYVFRFREKKLETLASYLWPDFCCFYSRQEGESYKKRKEKATVKFLLAKQIQAFLSNLKAGGAKWRVSRWRHSFKEGIKQRCLWKCGWNGALKSRSLYLPTYYTHEGTFCTSRIHAGHFGLYW